MGSENKKEQYRRLRFHGELRCTRAGSQFAACKTLQVSSWKIIIWYAIVSYLVTTFINYENLILLCCTSTEAESIPLLIESLYMQDVEFALISTVEFKLPMTFVLFHTVKFCGTFVPLHVATSMTFVLLHS